MPRKIRVLVILLVMAMAGYLVWFRFFKRGKTEVVFCDVGQGNGVLVQTGNFQVLYDVGSRDGKILKCLDKHMPFWDKEIDMVFISHWDNDHAGGFNLVGNSYKIGGVYSPYFESKQTELYYYTKKVKSGDYFRGENISFDVFWPDGVDMSDEICKQDDNFCSMGLMVTLQDKEKLKKVFYLMGDIKTEAEQKVVWRKEVSERADVILVGHHGSKTSTSEELLKLLEPKEAVISVGENDYGHPDNETLLKLAEKGVKIRRTDKEGDVVYEYEVN